MGGYSGVLGTLAVEIVGRLGEFEASMEDLSRETETAVKQVRDRFSGLNDIASGLKSAGIGLTAAITAPILGIGYAAVDAASDFQSSMNKIQAAGGITGSDLASLEEQALQLGASTQFSAQQAADGMAVLAASGQNTTQIMAQMPGVLDLAAAGELAVAEAARISTALLAQFGLDASEAGQASDLLAAASAACSANVGDFGTAMSFAGGIAHTAGLSMSEAAGAMVLMNQQGLEGSKMGTGLRQVISSLINPTNEAAEELDRLGIKTKDAAGNMLPLESIVAQAEKTTLGAAEAFTIFGDQGATAFLALKNSGSAALRDITSQMENSEGSAKRMAETLRQGLKGSIEGLKGSIETAGIALGTALLPMIQRMVEWGTRMVNEFVIPAVKWFGDLSPAMQTLVIALTGLAAAAGPLLLVLGGMASAFVAISEAVAVLSGPAALGALTGVLGTLAPIVAGVGLAFAAWYLLDTTGQVSALAEELGELKTAIDGAWGSIVDLGESLGVVDVNTGMVTGSFRSFWNLLGEFVAGPLHLTIEGLKTLAVSAGWVADKITAFRNLLPGVRTGMDEISGAIKTQTQGTQGLLALYGDLAGGLGKVEGETKKATAATNQNTGAQGKNADSTKKSKEEREEEKKALQAYQREVKFANDRVNDLLAAQERARVAAQKHAEDVRKITEDMEQFAAAIQRKNLPALEDLWKSLKEITVTTNDLKLPVTQLADALDKLGIKSAATAQRVAEDAKKSYDAVLQSGHATQWEKDNALVKVLEAQREAMIANGEKIPKDFDKMLEEMKTKAGQKLPETKGIFENFGTQVSTVITNFAQDISKSLWDGDMSWAEKGKSLLKSLGEAVTSSFIEPATAAIGKFISGVLADLLSGKGFGGLLDTLKNIGESVVGIFKAGSGGIPGVGGGKGGSGGSGGIGGAIAGGALGWASFGADLAGSILGFIGDMRMEGTLNAIEHEVRYSQIHLNYILDNLNTHLPLMWSLPELAHLVTDLMQPIWESRWFAMSLSGALEDQGSFWGRTAIGVENLLRMSDEGFTGIISRMDKSLDLASQMMVSGSKSTQVTLVGTDPAAVGATLATKLQLQGGLA